MGSFRVVVLRANSLARWDVLALIIAAMTSQSSSLVRMIPVWRVSALCWPFAYAHTAFAFVHRSSSGQGTIDSNIIIKWIIAILVMRLYHLLIIDGQNSLNYAPLMPLARQVMNIHSVYFVIAKRNATMCQPFYPSLARRCEHSTIIGVGCLAPRQYQPNAANNVWCNYCLAVTAKYSIPP